MRLHQLTVAALLSASLGLPCLAADATAKRRDDSAAEKLGFKLSLQCWTFNRLTFFETVNKAAELGLKYVEMYPGQKLKPGSSVQINNRMSDEVCAEIEKKLADAGGLKVIAYGVDSVPTDEQGARRVFDWAKKMGMEVLVTETTPNDVLDKLCTEYQIKLALHNHPKSWPPSKVLAACEGRCKLIGACGDTGHWMRAGYVPVDTLKKTGRPHRASALQGRQRIGHDAHDVVWGTGASDVKGMMAELKRQGYKGYFSIEYEYGSLDDLMKNLPSSIAFFDQTAAELAK